MHKEPWFVAAWIVLASWAWAAHVVTGFLGGMISHGAGLRSSVIGMLDRVTDAVLVDWAGRPLAALLIAGIGLATAMWTYALRNARHPRLVDQEPAGDVT